MLVLPLSIPYMLNRGRAFCPSVPGSWPAVFVSPAVMDTRSATVLLPGSAVVNRSVDIVWPPRVVVTSTIGDAAETVTFSSTPPTASGASTRMANPALRTSPSRMSDLKPCSSNLI